MTKENEEQKTLELYGISDPMELEKGKDMDPLFPLKNINPGDELIIEFLESKPRSIEYQSKENGVERTEKFSVIKINAISRKFDKLIDVMNIVYDLPLSAKTLALPIARIAKEHGYDLAGIKVMINVHMANFKNFGENRCYRVSEIMKKK